MWDKSQHDPDDRSKREPEGGGPSTGSDPSSLNPGGSMSALFSDSFSPTNTNRPSDGLESEPKLPVLRRCATSVGERKLGGSGSGLDEASAAAALQKAIRSSPHKFAGSEQVPIEIGDPTPNPTRRLLFPSPKQMEDSQSDNRSNAESMSKSLEEQRATSNLLDKENRPPSNENDIDRFFNDDAYDAANAFTSPASKSKYPWLSKTPTQSPNKPVRLVGSSGRKGDLLAPTTPSRTSLKQTGALAEFTPFTAHLNQLLSDAPAGSPAVHNFDFPTLPSLRNTPNSSRPMNFDFSQLDSQDLISTDVPMPSSPPPWNFGSFDEASGGGAGLWGDSDLPNTLSSPHAGDDLFNDEASGDQDHTVTAENPSIPAEAAT